MSHRRLGLLLASAALFASVAVDGASARRLHHRRVVVHRGVHTFAFRSPDAATVTVNSAFVEGWVPTGILGASTADPYEHPSYGYYVDGGRGPGYSYYGD